MTQKTDSQALVIPSGVRIEATDEGFILGNKGDVVIQGELALKIRELSSIEGSVRLHTDKALSIERVEARAGEVELSGPLTVNSILARRIHFAAGKLTSQTLVADESIVLKGEELKADIILGPKVELSTSLKGRATVIESKNEIGPNLLKGGFKLEEYLDMFPGGEALLDRHPDVKEALDSWGDEKLPEKEEDSEISHEAPPQLDADHEVIHLTQEAVARDSDAEGKGENAEAPDEAPDDEALYNRLYEAFIKIMGCYPEGELPPPLNSLENLIESRKFSELKGDINGIWSELLKFHKKQGLHIANAVTHNIQEIKRILQEAV